MSGYPEQELIEKYGYEKALDILIRTNDFLLGSGVDITTKNGIIQHLSCLSGGGVTQLSNAHQIIAHAMSDVPEVSGNPAASFQCISSNPLLPPVDIEPVLESIFDNQLDVFNLSVSIDANVVRAVSNSNVKKYIYAGTACSFPQELQNSTDSILYEKDKFPAHPESGYGWGKLVGELQTTYLNESKMVSTVGANVIFHNVYGPWCDFDLNTCQVIPALIRKASALSDGQQLEVWGGGVQARSFIYSYDIAKFLLKMVTSKSSLRSFNGVQLGGHTEINFHATVGGMTPVHQFCKIGMHSFIGGGRVVLQDVPPYILATGEPLKYSGINSVGLRRRNFTQNIRSTIYEIRQCKPQIGINNKFRWEIFYINRKIRKLRKIPMGVGEAYPLTLQRVFPKHLRKVFLIRYLFIISMVISIFLLYQNYF